MDKKLIRKLGGLDIFCIAAGAMISSGLFILPGIAFAKIGPAIIFAYILAGIAVLPAMFAKAELATAMPKAGGSYFFIERSMGGWAGTMGGIASWFSLSLKSAFALVGIGAFVTLINPNISEWEIKFIAVGFCLFFTILNLISVEFTSKIQVFLVIMLIILLIIYIFRGFFFLDPHKYVSSKPFNVHSLFAVSGMVFISFGGLTKIASVAEEIKNPNKNIPYGMIAAFCVVLPLYALTIFVTVGLLSGNELANSLTPLSIGGSKMGGIIGGILMSLAGILAFVSTGNAGILAASRFTMAMSRDGLLPDFFSRVSNRFKTPYFSIIFTGLFMMMIILFLNIESLVKVASTMQIILFLFVILSSIIMRESKIMSYKPAFISPLYPWIQILGIIVYLFFLYDMGTVTILTTILFVLISLLWHRMYVSGKTTRKSALIHIVERITAREIAGDSLNTELREILKERDQIIEDRFHKMVKDCIVLDLDHYTDMERFFTLVAQKMSNKLNIEKDKIFELLMNREKEGSTVLTPIVAVPHIVIDGEHNFAILLARCKAGIIFSESYPAVNAIFVLFGTRDERNYHLRALSSIAQILQDPSFETKWMTAKNEEALRDIVLFSKRMR